MLFGSELAQILVIPNNSIFLPLILKIEGLLEIQSFSVVILFLRTSVSTYFSFIYSPIKLLVTEPKPQFSTPFKFTHKVLYPDTATNVNVSIFPSSASKYPLATS